MQYCLILDVKDIPDATAVGMLLHRCGYKIVSAQVTPSSCPIQQQEVKPCDDCAAVAKNPAASTAVSVAKLDGSPNGSEAPNRRANLSPRLLNLP